MMPDALHCWTLIELDIEVTSLRNKHINYKNSKWYATVWQQWEGTLHVLDYAWLHSGDKTIKSRVPKKQIFTNMHL